MPVSDRRQGYPQAFYRITPEARDLFDAHGLFPRGPWQEVYRRVEKPPEIRDYEAVPRPDRDSETS